MAPVSVGSRGKGSASLAIADCLFAIVYNPPVLVTTQDFRPMHILGINAYHGGASACLIRDGKLIAAAEEERFNRIKYWAGFPVESIRYVLEEGGITPADL